MVLCAQEYEGDWVKSYLSLVPPPLWDDFSRTYLMIWDSTSRDAASKVDYVELKLCSTKQWQI